MFSDGFKYTLQDSNINIVYNWLNFFKYAFIMIQIFEFEVSYIIYYF